MLNSYREFQTLSCMHTIYCQTAMTLLCILHPSLVFNLRTSVKTKWPYAFQHRNFKPDFSININKSENY